MKTALILCAAVGLAGVLTSLSARRSITRRFNDPHPLRRAWSWLGAGVVLVAVTALAAIHETHVVGLVGLVGPVSLAACAVALTYLSAITAMRLRVVPAAPEPRRVLAVGAHPDDLEIAVGGTLQRLVDAGHEVHAIVMSDGACGGDAERRIMEARRGAAYMRLHQVVVHDFPDTALDSCTNGMREVIEAAMQRLDPHLIFTHSAHDQHQDHAAVHVATLRAARQHQSILCYESPSTTRDFDPSFFVDIKDYLPAKVEAVLIHADQATKPYMTSERIAATATFRGGQARSHPSEAFEAVRLSAVSLGGLF